MASRAVLCLLLGLAAAALCVVSAAPSASAIELAHYAYIITDVDEAASRGLPPHWKKHVDGVCTFDGKRASRCPRVGEDSWEFITAGEDDQVMDYLRKRGIVKAGEHADYTEYKFKKHNSSKYADKVYDDEDSYSDKQPGNRFYGARNSYYKKSYKKHSDDGGYKHSSHDSPYYAPSYGGHVYDKRHTYKPHY